MQQRQIRWILVNLLAKFIPLKNLINPNFFWSEQADRAEQDKVILSEQADNRAEQDKVIFHAS